ncbi:MAG: cell division protein SepF, partial [Clostridia bacterium]|nr:cell division protein SepF [Clostridia bacterium]
VLNLEATNKETSRRIIDFLSGVAYSISGNLKRVANNTFVITPCNVDVSNDVQETQKAQPKPQTNDIYDNLG